MGAIWQWPIEGRQQQAGTAGALTFVGSAGDFDSRGMIAHPGDLAGQVPGAMQNVAAALAIEGCGLDDIVRLKVFYKSDGGVDEAGLFTVLAKHFTSDPLPAITLHPTPLQPFTGQALQAQAIAKRGWRASEFRVATGASLAGRKITLALRAGEFIAVPARTAIDERGQVLAAGDGPEQTRIVMQRLQDSLQAVGASLQDAVKKEGYYFGTTQDQWAPMAKVRASFFREPGPVATVVPCHTLWPKGALTKVEVLAMRESWNGFDKYIPREDRWPKRVWDWPVPLPYRQAIRLRDQIWLGGQVPWATNSNAGNVVLAGQLLPQTQFTMSYIEDLLGGFGRTTADLKLVIAYFTSGGSEEETRAFIDTVRASIAGPLPPMTVCPSLICTRRT